MANRYDKFDIFCVLLLIPITVFALTPSSYGAVLSLFGFDGEGLIWGKPRMIRSDEWAVWTPYIQMAVLNGFERFNDFSTYHHDLRGFNAVPLADWGLFFKPFMWPFWILEPARAFALHHGLIIITFLIGWKRLLVCCLTDIDISIKQRNLYAIFFSVLIFFTGFVQFWWTTLGPLLSLSPWLLLIILQWKHTFIHYLKLFYLASVWLLSHTYPPIIISITYFGFLLLCVHHSSWWRSSFIQLVLTGVACISAVVVCVLYYRDIIPVMINTVYPGQRISQGGEGNGLILLSTLFPYITHSRFSDLLNLNICEVGSVGTLLPLAVICFVQVNWMHQTFRKAFFGSLILGLIIIVWALIPISENYGKWFLLDKVPGNRTVFILGLLANYTSLIALASGKISYSTPRSLIFIALLSLAYLFPSYLNLIGWLEKFAPEMVAIVLMVSYLIFFKHLQWLRRFENIYLLFIVLLPNIVSYAGFNPIQKAYPIFDLYNRQVVDTIKYSANKNYPQWVIEPDYPGAVLSGLGLNSFTTVLVQPKISIFRDLYPLMPEHEFNQIFNRYAHIWLDDTKVTPYSPSPDVIVIPLHDMMESSPMLNYHRFLSGSSLYFPIGGVVDSAIIGQDNTLTITGWAWLESGEISGIFDPSDILQSKLINRPDVVVALSDRTLRYAGFLLQIADYSKYESAVKELGICLVSQDPKYGVKLLETNNLHDHFRCRAKIK
ncbi:hypothetical protein VMA_000235 [Vibrio mimicus VM223]|nr:hypothetical protein VMA_000235 [Vibrio mimicus VM223]